MNIRLFKINFNADASDASGGDNSSTMTEQSQSDVAGSAGDNTPAQSSEPIYDAAYFDDLNRKMEEEEYEPTRTELDKYDEFAKSGGKIGTATSAKSETQVNEPNPKSGESPNLEIDVQKLVKEEKYNTWTAEESAAVEAAMKKVGAKNPRELSEKVAGALSLAGEKGSEVGTLRQQLAEKEAALAEREKMLESHIALDADLRAGKPEAMRFLQEEYGLTAAQAKQVQAEAQAKQSGMEIEIPENVIDIETYRAMKAMEAAHKAEIARLQGTLSEVTTAQTLKQQEERKRIETEQRAAEIQKARNNYIEQILSVAEADPERYAVKSASLRDLFQEYYRTGTPDPRITPHIDLMKFAYQKEIPDVRDAHKIMDYPRLSEKIIAARNEGRNSALNTVVPQSLSSVRSKTNGVDMNPQTVSEEEFARMERGEVTIPESWKTGQNLDRNKVPPQFRARVFGNL